MVGLSLEEAQKEGVVIGLKDISGIRPRLDIDDFLMTYPDTFNLFILAIRDLQTDSSKMGWFEVAGIHGYPTRDWDGVSGRNKTETSYGYCTHGTVLFPFWHRPYMAMMEQTIYHAMMKKAEKFSSNQTRWKAAVQEFRLPYWDWLRPRAKQVGHTVIGIGKDGKSKNPFDYVFDLPRILKEEIIMVYLPSLENPNDEKTLKPISNPLYSFSFENSKSKILEEQWKRKPLDTMSSKKTVRNPIFNKEQSDVLYMNGLLNKQRESNVIGLLNLFVLTTYSEYLSMSNHAANERAGFGSIESLHDNYHDYVGGGAHMGTPEVAAFDPVFWFHHCNIDRVMAIWQATHPERWFSKKPLAEGPDDPLYPFRAFKNGKPDWWTSNDAKDTKAFGYTYADLDPVGAEAVFEKFGRKYVWSIHEESRPNGFGDVPPEDMEPILVNDSPFFKYELSKEEKKPAFPQGFKLASLAKAELMELPRQVVFKVDVPEEVEDQGQGDTSIIDISGTENITAEPLDIETAALPTTLEPTAPMQEVSDVKTDQPEETKAVRNWYVDSLVPKDAFKGCGTLFYFVTGADYIRKPYIQEPSLAALNHIFSAPVEGCSNCARQVEAGVMVSDTEAITPILLDIVKNTACLESIEPEHVVPFLANNFQVRILGSNSEDVEPRTVPGLKLSISTTVQYYKPGSLMATDGPKNIYPEITDPILMPPAAVGTASEDDAT